MMSVIAVGNQIDCTHRPSKYLYSHIQQTSAKSTTVLSKYRKVEHERCNEYNYTYSYVVVIILLHVGHKLVGYE